MQAASHAGDTDRLVKSFLAVLFFGNENVDIDTGIRNDNPIAVLRGHSIKSVTMARGVRGFLGSNSEDLDINKWMALSHIMVGLTISDGLKEQRPNPSRYRYYRRIFPKRRVRRIRMFL